MNAVRGATGPRAIASAIAVLFGVLTLFAGGRVLLGTDPGYVVFLPLLIYNTAMGVAYIGAGALLFRTPSRGRTAAGAIFLLNLLVLVAIGLIYRSGGGVAVDSLRAMSLRTVVWLGLFSAALWFAPRGAQRPPST